MSCLCPYFFLKCWLEFTSETIWAWRFLFSFFFLAPLRSMQDLVPPPGIKPTPPAVETRSLNHWTAREVPRFLFQTVFGFLNLFIYLFIYLFIHLFIYLWLCCVFVAARGLSLAAASGGYSLLRCTGFSLRWLLLLWSTGSRLTGFSSCGTWAQ